MNIDLSCPSNRQIYISVMVSYLNLLAYFYIILYTISLPNIIMDGHWFQSMTVYNIYFDQLLRGSKAFLVEIQGLEYILEIFKTSIEMGNNFAKDVREKNNWKQAGFSKKE